MFHTQAAKVSTAENLPLSPSAADNRHWQAEGVVRANATASPPPPPTETPEQLTGILQRMRAFKQKESPKKSGEPVQQDIRTSFVIDRVGEKK